jgi:hypothetical protein
MDSSQGKKTLPNSTMPKKILLIKEHGSQLVSQLTGLLRERELVRNASLERLRNGPLGAYT